MTVIAWDGLSVSSDRFNVQDNLVFESASKIQEFLRDGVKHVVGSTGRADIGAILEDWVINGEDPATFPKEAEDSTFVVVMNRSEAWVYTTTGKKSYITHKFWAWGAGNEVALGAMAAGAHSAQAVAIACQYNRSCRLPLDTIFLE